MYPFERFTCFSSIVFLVVLVGLLAVAARILLFLINVFTPDAFRLLVPNSLCLYDSDLLCLFGVVLHMFLLLSILLDSDDVPDALGVVS